MEKLIQGSTNAPWHSLPKNRNTLLQMIYGLGKHGEQQL